MTQFQHPQEPDPVSQTGAPKQGGGLMIAGFVLGVVSMLAWCVPIVGLPVSITGLVLSIKAQRAGGGALAIAGIVLNAIGLVATIANAAIGAYLGATGQHPLFNNQGTP